MVILLSHFTIQYSCIWYYPYNLYISKPNLCNNKHPLIGSVEKALTVAYVVGPLAFRNY